MKKILFILLLLSSICSGQNTLIDEGVITNSLIYTITTTGSHTIPTVNGYTYNFVVNWGDGNSNSVTSYNVGNSHTYSGSGTYTITITGTCQYLEFYSTTAATQIIRITSFGKVGITNTS